jgi:hypothetical protein
VNLTAAQKLAILFVAWLVLSGGSIGSPGKATAATYVHDGGVIEPAVRSGIDKLNREGIKADFYDVDTKNGVKQVPKQYTVAVRAAQEAGLPSLVATAGEKVTKIVKAPTTDAQVMEVVK